MRTRLTLKPGQRVELIVEEIAWEPKCMVAYIGICVGIPPNKKIVPYGGFRDTELKANSTILDLRLPISEE